MAKRGKLPEVKMNAEKTRPQVTKVSKAEASSKVKLPLASVAAVQSPSRTSAWQMDSFSVHCIASNYDPLSPTGVLLNVAIMDYERECAQAEIDLIDRIKLIINPPVIPAKPTHR
jgi:hypothetical protein